MFIFQIYPIISRYLFSLHFQMFLCFLQKSLRVLGGLVDFYRNFQNFAVIFTFLEILINTTKMSKSRIFWLSHAFRTNSQNLECYGQNLSRLGKMPYMSIDV